VLDLEAGVSERRLLPATATVIDVEGKVV